MAKRQEFDRRARAIEALVRTLEAAADGGLRATARELVQALMDLHRAGLERALELVDGENGAGRAIIDRLGDDEIVKHLLVLHGLHPLALEARVHQAIDEARPSLAAGGGRIEQVVVDETGHVRVTLRVAGSSAGGCGSPGAALKTIVEEAIYESAPDVAAMVVEVEVESAAAFIPLASVRRRTPDVAVGERSVAYP